MECQLEAEPSPTIVWSHSGEIIASSSRVEQTLTNLGGVSFKATLVIRVRFKLPTYGNKKSRLLLKRKGELRGTENS